MSALGRPVRNRTGHVGRVWALGPTPGTWWCIFPLLDARPHLYAVHSGKLAEHATMRLVSRVAKTQPARPAVKGPAAMAGLFREVGEDLCQGTTAETCRPATARSAAGA